MFRSSLAVVAVCAAVVSTYPRAAHAAYEVLELGADQAAGVTSVACAVNQNNMAAGYIASRDGNFPAVFDTQGGTQILSTTDGFAQAINASGEVVGGLSTGAFRWKDGEGLTALTMPVPGAYGFAYSISDTSTIHGRWASGEPVLVSVFRFANGAAVDLGNWGSTGGALLWSANSAGTMIGSRNVCDATGACVDEGVRVSSSGVVETMASIVGRGNPFPTAINERGDIGGYRFSPARGFVLIGNRTRAVALRGASTSLVSGINDLGAAVGYSDTGAGTATRAILWQRGKVTDLSALPEVAAEGWTSLYGACAINNGGTIVGGGVKAGVGNRAFMLRPLTP